MTAKPTNKDLQGQIAKVDEKVDRKHSSVVTLINKLRNEFKNDIQPIKDWIKDHEGYERGVKEATPKNGNGITFSSSTGDFIIKLVTAVAVGIAGVMIGRGL